MINGGEVYKCSSYGIISVLPKDSTPSYAYTGGICGMISGGLVMNSFTQCNVSVQADISYAGGISGLSENSSIQNVYTINCINQRGNLKMDRMQIFAGGISGYNSDGNISGAVAINPYIITNGTAGEICALTTGGYVDNNYYADSFKINSNKTNDTETGIMIALKKLKGLDFFVTPVEKGGLLGWLGANEGESVWIASSRFTYPFPTLSGVDNQTVFSIPAEIKNAK